MSVDTGLLPLVYNPNFPIPGVDQPSQQFRDNFAILKAAIESLQIATNDANSVITLGTNVDSDTGEITYSLGFVNNTLTLPIDDPSLGSPVAGMIRYHTTNSTLEFFDGTAWRPVVYKNTDGSVTLTNLTVSTRLTLGYTPTQPTDAVPLSYISNANANFSAQLAAEANTRASYDSFLNNSVVAEANARLNADTTLQAEIDLISQALANTTSNTITANASIQSLQQQLSDEANARISADSDQVSQIGNLSNSLTNFTVTFTANLASETASRVSGDQTLSDEINAVVTAQNANTTQEATWRIANDALLQSNITAVQNDLQGQISNTTANIAALENGKINRFGGDTVFGDITISGYNLTLTPNQYLFFDIEPNANGGGDQGFVTYDQNNFEYSAYYAANVGGIKGIVAAEIAANGVQAANELYEFGALRLGVTNDDFANVGAADVMALEPAASLYLNPGWQGTIDGTASNGAVYDNRLPTANGMIYVGNAANFTLSISRDTGDLNTKGNVVAIGDVTGLSDESVKTNVQKIDNALAMIKNLTGVTYDRIDMGGEHMGLIAQHVQPIVPQVVHPVGDLLGVAYGNLVALLIEGIKQLDEETKAEMTELRATVAALQTSVSELGNR